MDIFDYVMAFFLMAVLVVTTAYVIYLIIKTLQELSISKEFIQLDYVLYRNTDSQNNSWKKCSPMMGVMHWRFWREELDETPKLEFMDPDTGEILYVAPSKCGKHWGYVSQDSPLLNPYETPENKSLASQYN